VVFHVILGMESYPVTPMLMTIIKYLERGKIKGYTFIVTYITMELPFIKFISIESDSRL